MESYLLDAWMIGKHAISPMMYLPLWQVDREMSKMLLLLSRMQSELQKTMREMFAYDRSIEETQIGR